MSLNLSSARWSRCEWWAFIYGTVAGGQQLSLTKREQTNEKKYFEGCSALQCHVRRHYSRQPSTLQTLSS